MTNQIKNKKMNQGITLIALVITIIVLLILAGVSISTLTGQNGILMQAGNSKIETTHAQIYEAMQLEAQSYLTEKNAGGYEGTLLEYLNRDTSKPIVDSDGIINIKNLLGTTTSLGNGTSIASGDVYVLQEANEATGNINQYQETGKVATLESVKIAATTDNSQVKYEIVYYGKTESENVSLGFLYSNDSLVSDDVLEYGYLFKCTSSGAVTANYSYSYYTWSSSESTRVRLFSKNQLQLTNISLVLPSRLNGKKVTTVLGNAFSNIKELTKVKIPNSVTTIERYAFGGTGLKEIQIPVSVKTIGDSVFWGCPLDTVYYEGTEDQWKAISMGTYNTALTSANIIYNYEGNDIVEYAEESTTKYDDINPYRPYARNILNNLSEDEINELYYEGILYWSTSYYEWKYPGQEITKQLVAEDNGYTSYEDLIENIWIDSGYDSLEDFLIGKEYVKPAEYFGE